jgi:putative serine protease PepD
MDRLWTDGPPTRTYTPPQPPRPPVADELPAAPPPPPRRGGGRWLAALGGGTVSAVVVAAVLLGTGVADNDTPSNVPATTPVSVSQPSGSNADIARRVYAAASNSVVSIRTGSGSGTGFLVDSDGTIVTNAHVVGDSSEVEVRFEDGGDSHTAQVLGVDASTDLAAIKVDAGAADGVKPLALADSDKAIVGDPVVAIGYPLGLDRTATAGIVSGLNRDIQAPNGFSIDKVIQTDAPINPGNSGGPLLNASGQVIGVNSQIATAGGGNGSVGIGFAVPANTVRDVVPQLEKGSAPQHAYLGLSTGAAQNGEGAQVGDAPAGGPAAEAGIQPGDVITEVDGDQVRDPEDVAQAIENNKPGDRIDVKVRRGGSEQTIQVTLGERPEQLPSTGTP